MTCIYQIYHMVYVYHTCDLQEIIVWDLNRGKRGSASLYGALRACRAPSGIQDSRGRVPDGSSA